MEQKPFHEDVYTLFEGAEVHTASVKTRDKIYGFFKKQVRTLRKKACGLKCGDWMKTDSVQREWTSCFQCQVNGLFLQPNGTKRYVAEGEKQKECAGLC